MDYKYFVVSPNYLFYYIEDDTVYIAEMFNDCEDFMYQINNRTTVDRHSRKYAYSNELINI
ncbi:hypothetical protein, partial [Pseudobutyrivibrio sp.]